MFKELWNSIIESTQLYKDLKEDLEDLEKSKLELVKQCDNLFNNYTHLDEKYKELNGEFGKLNTEFNILTEDYKILVEQYEKVKPETLEEYKNRFFQELKITKYTHSYRGDGKKRQLHTHLDNFRNNKELREKYLNWMKSELSLRTSYNSADDLILHITNEIHRFVNNRWKEDKRSFDTLEYWLNPEEAFEYYVNKNNYGDCDDTGTFIYACLITALYYYGFESEIWRLMNGIVSIVGAGGHYTLTWLKADKDNNVIGWIVVESTYAQNLFSDNFKKNKLFKHNWLYQPIALFNEEAEFKVSW